MRGPAGLRRGLSGRQTGSGIEATFGLVYVEASASEIAQPGSLVVRFAAGSAFLACLVCCAETCAETCTVTLRRAERRGGSAPDTG